MSLCDFILVVCLLLCLCIVYMKPLLHTSNVHASIHIYVHEYIRRSSNDASPATKVLPLRSQKSMIERGASFPHMTLLQRIVSEQWYPAECRQRVPTAKSVTKTLSKYIRMLRTCMADEHVLYLVLSIHTRVSSLHAHVRNNVQYIRTKLYMHNMYCICTKGYLRW